MLGIERRLEFGRQLIDETSRYRSLGDAMAACIPLLGGSRCQEGLGTGMVGWDHLRMASADPRDAPPAPPIDGFDPTDGSKGIDPETNASVPRLYAGWPARTEHERGRLPVERIGRLIRSDRCRSRYQST